MEAKIFEQLASHEARLKVLEQRAGIWVKTIAAAMAAAPPQGQPVVCPRCEGSGTDEGEACPLCGGRGIVDDDDDDLEDGA
jgi:DnaJ-class molecular chaperone